jgi:hypothetical protein
MSNHHHKNQGAAKVVTKGTNFKLPEPAEKNPFSLPEDYFSTLSSRVNEKIKGEGEDENTPGISLWKRVRPHLALAAVIAGFALISFTALQLILGDKGYQQDYYELSLLDEAGILEEFVLQESLDYGDESEDTYTEWEEEAMTYLASSDVDLDLLLNDN